MSRTDTPSRDRRRAILYGLGAVALLAAVAALFTLEAVWTAPTREAVRAYTALIDAANRGDLPAVRTHCSTRYLASHTPRLADEGGVVGFPRGIHKNFRVWRQGDEVWLCPTNRVGPVFRFVDEDGAWKFDGPAGYLRPRNVFVPAAGEG